MSEAGVAAPARDTGRRVMQMEADAIQRAAARLGPEFDRAVERIRDGTGRVVVAGIGKSGIVARRIASTFASTGTPAFFLHPSDAAHGDAGVVVGGDLLLWVSRSGAADGFEPVRRAIRSRGVELIGLVGDTESPLARASDLVLDASVDLEACPHDVTPTSSAAVAQAIGDALAIAVLESRGVDRDELARVHPAGAIGRTLGWTVEDAMVACPEAPRARPRDTLGSAMHQIAHQRGTVPVVGEGERLVGVLTAGDLTRFAGGRPDFLGCEVRIAMNPNPVRAPRGMPAADALGRMQRRGVMALPVVDDEERVIGVVHLHDLLRAGVRPA